jgi:hypothetical protein
MSCTLELSSMYVMRGSPAKLVFFRSLILLDLQSDLLFEILRLQSGQLPIMCVAELSDIGGRSSTVLESLASGGNLDCSLKRDMLISSTETATSSLTCSLGCDLIRPTPPWRTESRTANAGVIDGLIIPVQQPP